MAWSSKTATCAVETCEKAASSRGWCNTHYERWRKHGAVSEARPLGRAMAGVPLSERFDMQHVKADNGCWLWTGALISSGYGHLWVDGRNVLAHRASYEMHVGPIPDGLHIDHLCRVRACVNPDHLEPVTLAENNRRAHAARHQAWEG